MEKEAAVQKVFNDVYLPVFLEKCASVGVRFKDMDEVKDAILTVGMLKQASEQVAATERANPQISLVKQAALDLAEVLSPVAPAQVDNELVNALNQI